MPVIQGIQIASAYTKVCAASIHNLTPRILRLASIVIFSIVCRAGIIGLARNGIVLAAFGI